MTLIFPNNQSAHNHDYDYDLLCALVIDYVHYKRNTSYSATIFGRTSRPVIFCFKPNFVDQSVPYEARQQRVKFRGSSSNIPFARAVFR